MSAFRIISMNEEIAEWRKLPIKNYMEFDTTTNAEKLIVTQPLDLLDNDIITTGNISGVITTDEFKFSGSSNKIIFSTNQNDALLFEDDNALPFLNFDSTTGLEKCEAKVPFYTSSLDTSTTLTFSNPTTALNQILIQPNLDDSLSIQEGTTKYLTFDTTTNEEKLIVTQPLKTSLVQSNWTFDDTKYHTGSMTLEPIEKRLMTFNSSNVLRTGLSFETFTYGDNVRFTIKQTLADSGTRMRIMFTEDHIVRFNVFYMRDLDIGQFSYGIFTDNGDVFKGEGDSVEDAVGITTTIQAETGIISLNDITTFDITGDDVQIRVNGTLRHQFSILSIDPAPTNKVYRFALADTNSNNSTHVYEIQSDHNIITNSLETETQYFALNGNIKFKNNEANALEIKTVSHSYIQFDSTTDAERIILGQSLTAPDITGDSLTLNNSTDQIVLGNTTITAPSLTSQTQTFIEYSGSLFPNNTNQIQKISHIDDKTIQDIDSESRVIIVTTGGSITKLSLPELSTLTLDRIITIKKNSSSDTQQIEILLKGGDTIDGFGTYAAVSTAYFCMSLASDISTGSWFIIFSTG